MTNKSLDQLTKDLDIEILTNINLPESVITSVYISDLLSDVMGKAETGNVWITSQTHKNIVAVASLKELSSILICSDRSISKEVIEHANNENVIILYSQKSTFELVGELYAYLKG